eukprot:scaffold80347_cov22-Tisochrysis_lutea.AAC.1
MLVHKGTVPCSPRPNARQQAVSRSGSLPSIRPLNKPSFRPLNKHLIACKAQAGDHGWMLQAAGAHVLTGTGQKR